MHAALELLEARARAVERDDLPVEHDLVARQRDGERAQLGVAGADVAPGARLQRQACRPATKAIARTPSHLIS